MKLKRNKMIRRLGAEAFECFGGVLGHIIMVVFVFCHFFLLILPPVINILAFFITMGITAWNFEILYDTIAFTIMECFTLHEQEN